MKCESSGRQEYIVGLIHMKHASSIHHPQAYLQGRPPEPVPHCKYPARCHDDSLSLPALQGLLADPCLLCSHLPDPIQKTGYGNPPHSRTGNPPGSHPAAGRGVSPGSDRCDTSLPLLRYHDREVRPRNADKRAMQDTYLAGSYVLPFRQPYPFDHAILHHIQRRPRHIPGFHHRHAIRPDHHSGDDIIGDPAFLPQCVPPAAMFSTWVLRESTQQFQPEEL